MDTTKNLMRIGLGMGNLRGWREFAHLLGLGGGLLAVLAFDLAG